MNDASEDARTYALLAHFSGILLSVLGPLFFWLLKKDKLPFVDDQGKEALNFQISVLIAYVICGMLASIVHFLAAFAGVIWLGSLILAVAAGLAANQGERYRYPFTLRLIK